MSMFYELMMRKKGMPERYQEVEYITMSGTQYIDTGVYGKNTTDYEIKWNETETDTYYGILGSRVSTTVDRLTIIGGNTEIYISNYNGSTYQTTFNVGSLRNIDVTLKKVGENLTLTFSTVLNKTILTDQNYQTPTTLKLGCIDTNGTLATYFVGRFYFCKLYDNGTLVRNFIPVYDTITQKYGMWESVQRKFYGNDGTGDFIGGNN